MNFENVKTIKDLEKLNIGKVYADVSYRGGGVGFNAPDVAAYFGIEEEQIPPKFGAGCNYMGGGIRGSIFPSSFSGSIPAEKQEELKALAQACVRVYENIENGYGWNDEEDENGEPNWNAKATKAVRDAGIKNAY